MAPVRPQTRIEVVDILRGFAILGILIFNMLSFSGYLYWPLDQMSPINRAAALFVKFATQAKFYTLFSFLFGWGMSIQMERAAQRGARFAPLFARRMLILLLIGLTHAILIWDGDILVTYAVLGLPLLLFRKRSDKALLVAVVVCILIPVLLSTPGPAASFREAYGRLFEEWREEMMIGYQTNVHSQGSYLELVLHRMRSIRSGYTNVIYWGTHVFGMFLLGLYFGKRKIFHHVSEHLPLFRKLMWWGLITGVPLNLIFVAVTNSPSLVPPDYYDLATRGARTIGGPALCLCYISIIVLLAQKKDWRRRLSPLGAVGRMALSNYLFQSIVCTLFFYGYGLGLYHRLGPAITLALTFALYRLQISLSDWWLSRYRFGPAEWMWRSLTYGKFQPLALARGARPKMRAAVSDDQTLSDWVFFIAGRLLFITAVAFAIVYFCTLGLRLSVNSTSLGRRLGVQQVAEPALDQTITFFEDALRGDLGYTYQGVTQRARVPVTEVLRDAYVESGRLLVAAIGLAALIGIGAGGLAASRKHSPLGVSTLTLTVIGVSIPSFFLALLLRIADIMFYRHTGVGLVPVFGSALDRTQSILPHVTFPALVLAARPLAHITRVTFVSISEILERDFIRTARAKGLRAIVVFGRHALRNAGVSILTAVVVSLRFALGSLPVVEIFFEWPGLGLALLNAIQGRDTTVVAALALSLGMTFLLINLLMDIIYRFIDPRLRAQSNGGEL